MQFNCKTTHEINKAQLEALFLALGWPSGHYPEKRKRPAAPHRKWPRQIDAPARFVLR